MKEPTSFQVCPLVACGARTGSHSNYGLAMPGCLHYKKHAVLRPFWNAAPLNGPRSVPTRLVRSDIPKTCRVSYASVARNGEEMRDTTSRFCTVAIFVYTDLHVQFVRTITIDQHILQ